MYIHILTCVYKNVRANGFRISCLSGWKYYTGLKGVFILYNDDNTWFMHLCFVIYAFVKRVSRKFKEKARKVFTICFPVPITDLIINQCLVVYTKVLPNHSAEHSNIFTGLSKTGLEVFIYRCYSLTLQYSVLRIGLPFVLFFRTCPLFFCLMKTVRDRFLKFTTTFNTT